MTRQLEYMSAQVKDWITKIGFSHLPTYHKRVSFSTRLMAQLSYPLPVLLASESQLDKVFNPLLPILKQMFSLAKSAPNNILFLGKEYGGYNIPNLHLRSLAAKMEFCVTHMFEDSFVGTKYKILAENLQFESGISSNIFKPSNNKARRLVTDSLLTLIVNQLKAFGITMWISMKVPKGPTLMDVALKTGMSDEQLLRLNNARLHYKYLYWHQDTTYNNWPRRQVKRNDSVLFETFVRNHRNPSPLQDNYNLTPSKNATYKLTTALLQEAQCGKLMCASDG